MMNTAKLLRIFLLIMFYASLASLSPIFSQVGSENPTVVQAIPPIYPSIARAANVGGVVLIEIGVDPNGAVTAAKIIEGHKLLNLSAERAASKWKFSPSKAGTERRIQLRFEFILIASNQGSPDDLGVIFWPPYKIEVRDAPYRVK